MPTYEKGTLGKLIVQDWNVLDNYTDALVLRWLSPRQCAALIALADFLSWKTRYRNQPGQDVLDAFQAETRYNLMTEVQFCALMIGCITTDEDVQQAIVDFLIDQLANNPDLQQAVTNVNYYNNNPGLPSKPETSGNILGLADCIKDDAAGFVRTGVVDRAMSNITQMFDVMILATTDEQKKLAFLDAIPVVGELLDFLVVADVIGFVANISTWIKAQFEAEDTTALRERWYRDLLCLYMQNCELSIEEIRDYFWNEATKVNAGFNDAIGTAVDLYNFLINGTASSFVGIAPVLMAVQFGGAYFIDSLFNMPLDTFKLLAALGDPTDDWIAWEALYGVCECYESYFRPDNVPPDFEVSVGVIGIENVLAASQLFSVDPTSWIIAEFDITVPVGVTRVEWIVDSPGQYAWQLYGTVSDVVGGSGEAYYVSPGKYGFSADITGWTEHAVITNFRRHPIPNTEDFLWLELRFYSPC